MYRLVILSVSLIFSTSSFAQTNTLIHNVSIISPELAEPVNDAYVLLNGDRIQAVGQGKGPDVSKGTNVIDGKKMFLIPGLIDAHVHLMAFPGMNQGQQKELKSIADQYLNQLPRSYLYYGYTTLIDLAVIDRAGLDVIKASPLTPDMYDCGQPVPLANGYPMSFMEPEARFQVFKNFLFDRRQKDRIPAEYQEKDHTPKAAVERVKKEGGICVKTHYEPGFDNETLPTPTAAMLTELARESKKAGLKLLIHANSLKAQSFALSAPPDIFVHGMWNWGDLHKEQGLPVKVQQTLDKIASRKIGYMPTFQVLDGTRALFDPKFLDLPELKQVIPKDMIAWFKTKDGQWFADFLRKQIKLSDAEIATGNEKRMTQLALTVQHILAKNGRLLFGTDSPASPTYGNLPGLNGYLEMRRWANAKVALSTLLRSATLANAEAFGLEKDYGTVSKGKVSNLLLLAKNPLLDIAAFDSIHTVIIRGKVVPRGELTAR